MILFVNGISRGVQCNNLGYCVSDYESAFDILTQLVADNWLLEKAVIIDGTDRLTVPVDAFDGQPIQVHLQALQHEWQQILATQPVLPPRNRQHLKNWYYQLDAFYERQLIYLEKMILILEIRKVRLVIRKNKQLTVRLNDQYNTLLASNRVLYQKTKASQEDNRSRLIKLAME